MRLYIYMLSILDDARIYWLMYFTRNQGRALKSLWKAGYLTVTWVTSVPRIPTVTWVTSVPRIQTVTWVTSVPHTYVGDIHVSTRKSCTHEQKNHANMHIIENQAYLCCWQQVLEPWHHIRERRPLLGLQFPALIHHLRLHMRHVK